MFELVPHRRWACNPPRARRRCVSRSLPQIESPSPTAAGSAVPFDRARLIRIIERSINLSMQVLAYTSLSQAAISRSPWPMARSSRFSSRFLFRSITARTRCSRETYARRNRSAMCSTGSRGASSAAAAQRELPATSAGRGGCGSMRVAESHNKPRYFTQAGETSRSSTAERLHL